MSVPKKTVFMTPLGAIPLGSQELDAFKRAKIRKDGKPDGRTREARFLASAEEYAAFRAARDYIDELRAGEFLDELETLRPAGKSHEAA